MATCPPCNESRLPQCGQPAQLICLQQADQTSPIAAWFVPVCVEGEVVAFDFFADEALTEALVGYTMADRVNCPADLRGINCDAPVNADLCPATLLPILGGLENIEDAVQASQTAIVNQIDASGDQISARLVEYEEDGTTALPVGFAGLPRVLAYDGSDRLETITVTLGPDVWVKTFTYTGDNLTGISGWVEQP